MYGYIILKHKETSAVGPVSANKETDQVLRQCYDKGMKALAANLRYQVIGLAMSN